MNNTAQETSSGLTKAIFAVAGFGVLLTIVTELSHHYPVIMELCGGDTSGCADVASTPFSKIFGVSVAYWGLLAYVAFIASMIYMPPLTLPLVSAMLGAELYFMWIMSSVIGTYCTFCIIQFVTVVILFILTMIWYWRREDFLLPGRLYSVPVVALATLALLAVPVMMKSDPAPLLDDNLLTYEGDTNSNIRIELFSDYQCGHCRSFEPIIDQVVENHPDVLLIFRDYILRSTSLSPVAVSYANAIAYTKGREEFVKTRSEMFKKQDQLYDYLKKHLDEVEFTDELKSKIDSKVDKDLKRANALGVYSTPTMAIYRGDKLVQVFKGVTEYEKIARYLKQ